MWLKITSRNIPLNMTMQDATQCVAYVIDKLDLTSHCTGYA